jgi:hypothetical protein
MPVEKRERRQPGTHEGREPGLGGRLSRFEARLPRLPAGGDGTSRQAAELAARMAELTKVIGDLGPLLDELAPGVIGTETVILDANGQATKQFRVPFRSLGVDYFGATILTVTAAPLAGAAPGPGPGVAKLAPGGFSVVNMRAYVASFYGNPGDLITFTAYAKPQPANGVVGHQAVATTLPQGNPAAGAGFTFTVPPGPALPIAAVAVFFTASAAVANRFIALAIKDPAGNTVGQIVDSTAIVANNTIRVTWSTSIGSFANGGSGQAEFPLPVNFPLPPGWQIVITVSGEDVADQLSQIVITTFA